MPVKIAKDSAILNHILVIFQKGVLMKQDSWGLLDAIHQDLLDAKNRIYNPCGFKCSQPVKEEETAEYGAYTFKLDGLSIKYLVAKITPTKVGQFVTLWKRIGNGPIQPYDVYKKRDQVPQYSKFMLRIFK